MKNVLIACASRRDRRELSFDHVKIGFNVFFYTYDQTKSLQKIWSPHVGWIADTFDPLTVIEELVSYAQALNVHGVAGSDDYPASIFTSIVAQSLGLPGAHPVRSILCHHKYYARQAQQKYVSEAVPEFCIINPREPQLKNFTLSFPFFIKPVKSRLSAFATVVHNWQELRQCFTTHRFPQQFIQQFNWFLRNYLPGEHDTDHLLAETLLEGNQVTVEGYVYKGHVHILGVVDSIMYPGTISFERFEYPSSLSMDVQERMALIAKKCITGIGLDNTLFNIEMMYNSVTNGIHIIEINPRMSSQFADLFEKVDGFNTYSLMLQLATGIQPTPMHRKGTHVVAASFVLRLFEDKLVSQVPTEQELARLHAQFPDLRIEVLAQEGKRLSHDLQDGKSYRYGLINLGGTDFKQLYASFNVCKQSLTFAFND